MSKATSELEVMNLQVVSRATILATPPVPFEDLVTQLSVCCRFQATARLFLL
jgi:hypothetical protein